MPSEKSLQEQQYYAHPRNAFWPIMCRLLDAQKGLSYQQRRQLLLDKHVALWDVLRSCSRPGSLDSNIDQGSIQCNDFGTFFKKHTLIQAVFFNGGMAEALFRRHVARGLSAESLDFERLPSTSPAHASRTFAQKLAAWKVTLDYL